jgi:PAS domain S-box-containing protein
MTISSGKDLETALRESEDRYRQLTESLPQLVWTCTPEGECDYLSPQWVAYTGMPAEIHLNLGWMEQIHPDDRTATFTAWSAAVRTGQPFRLEMRIRGHDGQYRWFESRAIPQRDERNQIVKWFGSSADIHEAREMRLKLETERKRLANLVALAPAVFCSYALRPDGSAGFPYVSSGVKDLYGLNREDLEQDAGLLFARIHPDDVECVTSSIQASAETMTVWHCEFRFLHPTKGERWIEGRSTPAREEDGSIVWHGFAADITERKLFDAHQRFLFDLDAATQAASDPAAIARLATQMVCDYFNLERCSLTAICVPRNEATTVHEHTRGGDLPSHAGTYSLTMWGSDDCLGSWGRAPPSRLPTPPKTPSPSPSMRAFSGPSMFKR